MSTTVGQDAKAGARWAATRTGRLLHRILQLVLALVVLIAIGVGVLAIRLAQGPMQVAWVARRITEMANGGSDAVTVTVGAAALQWEGLRGGTDRPLDLALTDVVISDKTGALLARVPKAEVSLMMGELLHARLAFRTIALDGAHLRLRRDANGTITLDRDTPAASNPSPPAATTQTPSALQTLTAPPPSATQRMGLLSALRRVRVRNLAIDVDDRGLGLAWSLPAMQVDLSRAPEGGASGTASADLAIGAETLHADARLALLANNGGITATATLARMIPARLAALSPILAPMAALDAPVVLSGALVLDGALGLRNASLKATLEAGTIHAGEGIMPIRAATLSAQATLSSLDVQLEQLVLQARDEAPPTHIALQLAATRAAGTVTAKASVDIDQVAFIDLPALWPAGIGGPGTRPWITKNITAGIAHNGHVEVALTAPEDFSDATVTTITGGIDGSDVTGHWLRPVPPIEHGEAKVVFVDPDTMDILISTGQQSGSKLALKPSKVRLTGIAGHDQFVAIQANLFGPFADLLTLLRHPKIQLLNRRPIDIRNPSGQMSGLLTVNLPLKNDLDIDNVAIHAVGKLVDGHLGGIAVGRDIDRAMLDFDVNNDGLAIGGTADLAGIPAQLKIDMDFKSGGPAQVMQRVGVTAAIEPRQFAALGLNTGATLTGPIGVQVDYFDRRDTSGDLSVKADLARAGVEGGRLPWNKKPGAPGALDAHILLKAGRISGIDRIRAEAPGLSVLVNADTQGGRPNLVRIQKLIVGTTTDLTGDVRLPDADGQPYIVNIAGPTLDLSSEFDRKSTSEPASDPDAKGPVYRVDARLGRVLMASGRVLTQVVAKIDSDGRLTNSAQLSAIAGTGPVTIAITPERGGRRLQAQAADAGALLQAVDVVKTMSGGQLVVRGTFDDTTAAHALRGTAEIGDFRMRNAPSIGRILQAMSLYGLVEIAQGPGLGFTQLVAPFRLSRDVLTLGEARAYSASLGVTVKGTIDLNRSVADLDGTVIPAYFFNSLLGRVPLVGRLFSPEAGGGVFAATYSVRGKLDDPSVSVNPLAALTPGFLRGFFDIFDSNPAKPSSSQTSPLTEHQR